MKARLQSLLPPLPGGGLIRSLVRRFRRERPDFSEADLVLAHFSAFPRRGVMVDVGAHFGESLQPYLEQGWRVFAFEPDAANRTELQRRIPAHARLALSEVALSNYRADDVPFFASEESTGISSLSAFRDTHREVQRVQVTTLAEALPAHLISRVDFLKIDAEGHDLFVLNGFPWERLNPEVVLCEFEDRKTRPLGYDYRTLGDFLVSREYQVFLSEWHPIVRYGGRHRWRAWRSFPCPLHDSMAWGNFVALRAGTDPRPLSNRLRSLTQNV